MRIKPPEHKKIIDLLVIAGQEALRIRDAGELNARMKTGEEYSVVTEADIAAHNIITEGLSALFPGTKIISEEDKKLNQTGEYTTGWVIDPIDGTSDFRKGGSQFGVLVAYVENGVPIHGFAYYPAQEYSVVYSTGEDGEKSYKQKVNIGEAKEVSYDRPVELRTRSSVATPRVTQIYTDVKDIFPGDYTLTEHSSPSSTIAMIEGQTDIAAGPNTMMDWDLAAIDAIARKSGAVFVSTDDKKPLTYGDERAADRAYMQKRYLAGNVDTLRHLGLINAESIAEGVRR